MCATDVITSASTGSTCTHALPPCNMWRHHGSPCGESPFRKKVPTWTINRDDTPGCPNLPKIVVGLNRSDAASILWIQRTPAEIRKRDFWSGLQTTEWLSF
jgi:hypothetical protein